MSVEKSQLAQEIRDLKSQAYDILANLEFLQKQFQSQSGELQKQLGAVNQQIAAKDQVLQNIKPEVKESVEKKELLTEG